MLKRNTLLLIFTCSIGWAFFSCKQSSEDIVTAEEQMESDTTMVDGADSLAFSVIEDEAEELSSRGYITLSANKTAGEYYNWINFWVDSINRRISYPVDEYILVHANPWIIDSLRNTDYYYLRDKGINSLDPKAEIIAEKDAKLWIPDSTEIAKIKMDLAHTYIDVNIPEFLLRIYQHNCLIDSFSIRVGRNETRFLAMAEREVDLRTRPGIGTIVRINRQAAFINPRDNKKYHTTKRDDGVVTQLPNIPWIEPEINGIRHGHLIHPTTNIETLGRASSNGCIGMREADAWTFYFYARLGTPIQIRYDLEVHGVDGELVQLEDIYPGFEKFSRRLFPAQSEDVEEGVVSVCYCGRVE
jgi:hypothetical protein